MPTQESAKQPNQDCMGIEENMFPMPGAQ